MTYACIHKLDPNRGGRPDNARVLLSHASNIAVRIFETVDSCPRHVSMYWSRVEGKRKESHKPNALKVLALSASI